MEDLEKGMNENGLIRFVKHVLLNGDNPRGDEAVKNLEWGINQYRKHLILHGVVSSSDLIVIELSDEELKIVTEQELERMQKEALEFDGFEGWYVKGRLVRQT